MARIEEIQRQMAAITKARDCIITKLDDAMKLPDAKKKELWDDVVPICKRELMNLIDRGVAIDMPEFKQIVFDKVLRGIAGADVLEQLTLF